MVAAANAGAGAAEVEVGANAARQRVYARFSKTNWMEKAPEAVDDAWIRERV